MKVHWKIVRYFLFVQTLLKHGRLSLKELVNPNQLTNPPTHQPRRAYKVMR
jgi:hypothetical protein